MTTCEIIKTCKGAFYFDPVNCFGYIKIREGKNGQTFLRCMDYRNVIQYHYHSIRLFMRYETKGNRGFF